MPVTIVQVEPLGDYRLRLVFGSGEVGEVDLGEVIRTVPTASPLRDPSEFAGVHLDDWPTLVWPCGFGLAPEYAYRLATGTPPAWTEPVRQARSA